MQIEARALDRSKQRFKHYAGKVIGPWTLIEYVAKGIWRARCVCGTERVGCYVDFRGRSGCSACNKAYFHNVTRPLPRERPRGPRKPLDPPPPPKPRITLSDCRQLVGEFYSIPKDEMVSRTRMRKVARPRQMAMTLARELTDQSFPAIARHFGITDHTTVVYAAQRVHEREEESHCVAATMEHFRLALLTFKAQQAVTLMGGDHG